MEWQLENGGATNERGYGHVSHCLPSDKETAGPSVASIFLKDRSGHILTFMAEIQRASMKTAYVADGIQSKANTLLGRAPTYEATKRLKGI